MTWPTSHNQQLRELRPELRAKAPASPNRRNPGVFYVPRQMLLVERMGEADLAGERYSALHCGILIIRTSKYYVPFRLSAVTNHEVAGPGPSLKHKLSLVTGVGMLGSEGRGFTIASHDLEHFQPLPIVWGAHPFSPLAFMTPGRLAFSSGDALTAQFCHIATLLSYLPAPPG